MTELYGTVYVWPRFPAEADAPLAVDADGVLAVSVAFESFESVAEWNAQVDEFLSCVQVQTAAVRPS